MARLIYSAITSLDGYVADESGSFEWAEPDESVHTFINGLERSVGTYLFGRRMYEVMAVWDTLGSDPAAPGYIRDFADSWMAASKVVYSRTLEDVSTTRTTLVRQFDPDEVRRMKADLDRDIGIGGPTLAAAAIEAGLIDEYQVFVVPIVVGGGLRYLPDHLRVKLELLEERRFENGTVFLRYRPATG